MNKWSHSSIKFINDEKITAYCLSEYNFVHDNVIRNVEYSHTLECDDEALKMFDQGKYEDEKENMLENFNT